MVVVYEGYDGPCVAEGAWECNAPGPSPAPPRRTQVLVTPETFFLTLDYLISKGVDATRGAELALEFCRVISKQGG